MHRRLALCALLLVLGATAARSAPLRVLPVSPAVIRALDRFEVRVPLAPRGNPFDPAEAAVQARFLSPRGHTVTIDGFWYQGFTRTLQSGREALQPQGPPEWRIRFTPELMGTWAYVVTARDRDGTRVSSQHTFRVIAPRADHPGFVVTAGRYFGWTRGGTLFPVGENLAYSGPQATYAYDTWLERLARQQATYARIWVGPFTPFRLETAAGRYDLRAAWRLDHVLDTAERCGIRIALCADTFSSLRIRPGPALWSTHPYNRARGGFLAHPSDFFTDPRARAAFQQRLRYLSARYGCSPNVFSWELMNEVDLTEDFDVTAVVGWIRAVARALRAADPYGHPITVSAGAIEGVPEIDALPEIDYVQTHLYGAGDLSAALDGVCREKTARFDRPHLVTETAPSVRRAVVARDTQADWLHDALWAPVFAGAAGSGMPWGWDDAMHARNRYDELGALARFVDGVPWTSQAWAPVRVLETRTAAEVALPRGDVFLMPPRGGWQLAPYNRPVTIEVSADGTVRDLDRLARLLHGPSRTDLHNPATFIVDAPRPPHTRGPTPESERARFVAHVWEPPSDGSQLHIEVDGRTALDVALTADDHAAPRAYAVPLEPGRHVVRVANVGSGVIPIAYEVTAIRPPSRPALQVHGLTSKTWGLVRVANAACTWPMRMLGRPVRPVPASVVVLEGFSIGDYVVEEWNPATGTSIPYRQRCVDGRITLRVPMLRRDAAYRIHPPP